MGEIGEVPAEVMNEFGGVGKNDYGNILLKETAEALGDNVLENPSFLEALSVVEREMVGDLYEKFAIARAQTLHGMRKIKSYWGVQKNGVLDSLGVDIVIERNDGRLVPLQVTSTRRNVEDKILDNEKNIRRPDNIPMIWLRNKDYSLRSNDEIDGAIMGQVNEYRGEIKKEFNGISENEKDDLQRFLPMMRASLALEEMKKSGAIDGYVEGHSGQVKRGIHYIARKNGRNIEINVDYVDRDDHKDFPGVVLIGKRGRRYLSKGGVFGVLRSGIDKYVSDLNTGKGVADGGMIGVPA